MPEFEVKVFQWANTESYVVEADSEEAAKQKTIDEHLKNKDLIDPEVETEKYELRVNVLQPAPAEQHPLDQPVQSLTPPAPTEPDAPEAPAEPDTPVIA